MMKALPPAMSSVGSGLVLSKSHMQKAMDIPASQQTIDISASTVPEVAPKPQPKQNLLPPPKTQPLLSAAAPPDFSKMSRAQRARIDPEYKSKLIQQQVDAAQNIPVAGTSKIQDLDDAGLGEDNTKKNVDKKLEDDFEIDPKMKKAFGDALALPAKSAAVALIDLLEKIPAPSKEASKILNRNMTKIANAFKLGAASTEVANDEEDNDEDDDDNKPTLLQALIQKGLNFLGGGDKEESASGEPAGQISGSSPSQPMLPQAGDPTTGKRAPYTGTADGIGLGDGSSGSRAMQPIKKRKGLAKKLFGMTPLGMAFNAGGKMLKGAKGLAGNVMGMKDGAKNLAKKAFMATPMGMGLKLGMKAFGGIKNIFNPPDAPQQSLTELTDRTIQENREAADENTKKSIAAAAGTGDVVAAAGGNPPPFQQEGGELAQPNIEESPFINVYNTTSQF